MYLVELMKGRHVANLSFGETTALFKEQGDAVTWAMIKSTVVGEIVKVSADGREVAYFSGGEKCDWAGRIEKVVPR